MSRNTGFFSGLSLKNEIIATLGEFIGTTLFLWLAEGTAKSAMVSTTAAQMQTQVRCVLDRSLTVPQTSIANVNILIIATGFGLSLLTTAWVR